jgi:hypothetical protein
VEEVGKDEPFYLQREIMYLALKIKFLEGTRFGVNIESFEPFGTILGERFLSLRQ